MTSRYESSPASLRALRDRLTAAAKREGVVFGRLQQHVGVLVVAEFMGSLTDDRGEPLLLVKGGASLELRRGIPESRTSKDLDAVIRGDVEVIHDRLAEAGAAGWEGFTAGFTPPVEFEVPGLVSHPHRFTAKLSYNGKPFVSVPIEVSPIEAGNADGYDKVTSEALSLVGLPNSSAVPCMTLPWQIAKKVHACTDPLEALIVDEPLDETLAACISVFEARAKHGWPPDVVALKHWGPIYTRALEGLEELGLAPTVEEAVERVQAFVDRIGAASARS